VLILIRQTYNTIPIRQSRFKWKEGWPSSSQQRDHVCTLHFGTLLRKVPTMGLVHGSACWNGWIVTRMPTAWLMSILCVWMCCNFCVLQKLPSFLHRKTTIAGPIKLKWSWANRPLNFKRSAFDAHSSFSGKKWLEIIAKTLTSPKRCPTPTNSQDYARLRACKEACCLLGRTYAPVPWILLTGLWVCPCWKLKALRSLEWLWVPT